MSETVANTPQPLTPGATSMTAARAEEPQKKKTYKYVRIRLCMPGNAITTISLDPELVERATRVLGSEQKVREVAQAAALSYIEGKSPARTRSNFAARELLRLVSTPTSVMA